MMHMSSSYSFVVPAKAGTQGGPHTAPAALDPRFRGGDDEPWG